MERIDVNILDRKLTLGVEDGGRDKILAGVAHADQLMKNIKSSSANLSVERVAIMASIYLAAELLSMESGDGPFKGLQLGDVQNKLNEINSLLDKGINELKAI